MKKPWLAALLNIIPGLGYLYIGTRKVFAWLVLASGLAAILDLFNPTAFDYYMNAPTTIGSSLCGLLIAAAFIVDAYKEAQRVSANKKPATRKAKA